jgi:hypothetical protein
MIIPAISPAFGLNTLIGILPGSADLQIGKLIIQDSEC